jgi:hypothetical protein
MGELQEILADPVRLRALSWNPLPPEFAQARVICNLFESIGTFVKLRSVDSRVACELWASVVSDCRRAIAPVAAMLRKQVGRNGTIPQAASGRHISERYASHAG